MSASGLWASDTNDSMPWVSASRPVAALSHSGMVISSRGSVIEMSGTRARPMIVIFTDRSVSVTMQNCETSAPVPEVLGIISSGGIGLRDQVDAAVVQDPAAVAGQDRDALGRVDAGAAAERDQDVAALLDVPLVRRVDLVVLGVRRDGGPDHRRQPGLARGGRAARRTSRPR